MTEAGAAVRDVLERTSPERYPLDRSRAFTSALLERCGGLTRTRSAHVDRQTGRVKRFDRGFGFIVTDIGEDVFVHWTGIMMSGFRVLYEGDRVEFTVIDTEKGSQAKDVRLIKE